MLAISMSSATFELSRASFDVCRLQLKATFDQYPGVIHSFKRDQ